MISLQRLRWIVAGREAHNPLPEACTNGLSMSFSKFGALFRDECKAVLLHLIECHEDDEQSVLRAMPSKLLHRANANAFVELF